MILILYVFILNLFGIEIESMDFENEGDSCYLEEGIRIYKKILSVWVDDDGVYEYLKMSYQVYGIEW